MRLIYSRIEPFVCNNLNHRRSQDLAGGGEYLFSGLEIDEAMRFARGFRVYSLPRENYLKWCNLVRFGVYFDHSLSLKN